MWAGDAARTAGDGPTGLTADFRGEAWSLERIDDKDIHMSKDILSHCASRRALLTGPSGAWST